MLMQSPTTGQQYTDDTIIHTLAHLPVPMKLYSYDVAYRDLWNNDQM